MLSSKMYAAHEIAYEISEFAGVVHAVVVGDGALEAKSAQVTSEKRTC